MNALHFMHGPFVVIIIIIAYVQCTMSNVPLIAKHHTQPLHAQTRIMNPTCWNERKSWYYPSASILTRLKHSMKSYMQSIRRGKMRWIWSLIWPSRRHRGIDLPVVQIVIGGKKVFFCIVVVVLSLFNRSGCRRGNLESFTFAYASASAFRFFTRSK